MKLYVNIVFKNGLEKLYNIETESIENPKKFIEDNVGIFKSKWINGTIGGSFTFVTVQGRLVAIEMDSISGIEMFLS
jgi:hypothetical protein